ncbi:MAG: hypothetical protein KM310_10495 [Clostridiales bacterium]|nr:hypothetical protein [Clostridiales bacterium]
MSQPDIEEWYQRYRAFLEPVRRFRGLQVPGAADGQERFWADRAYRGRLLADLYRALQSGDKAATRAAIQSIDNAVVYALERAGLPRGPVADVIVASPAEEPSLQGAAGVKQPECRIMINSFRVKRAIEGLIDLDDVLRTWIHESIHARQPFSAGWSGGYGPYPGYEEGMVDGLARILVRRLTGFRVAYDHPYDNYVNAMTGFARALGMKPEDLMRRLWIQPIGLVRAELERVIEENIGYPLAHAHSGWFNELYLLLSRAFERGAQDRKARSPVYWKLSMDRVLQGFKANPPRER